MKTAVYHCRGDKTSRGNRIYVGRPSLFGNPFEIGLHGSRREVIRRHRLWLETGESFGVKEATETRRKFVLDNLHKLKGQALGCWCFPKACHANTLAIMADKL